MQSLFIDGAGALGGDKDIESQRAPESPPEGKCFPISEHKRKPDRHILFAVNLLEGILSLK